MSDEPNGDQPSAEELAADFDTLVAQLEEFEEQDVTDASGSGGVA